MKEISPGAIRAFHISYTPEAEEDLRELHSYIALRSTRRRATGYIRRLRTFCRELSMAPHRGEQQLHRPGLRTIGFERRVKVVFAVFDKVRVVEIAGFDYAGRQREW